MNWWQTLVHQMLQTTWLEAMAAATGVTSVWWGYKENILVFPVGIVSVLCYVFIGFNYRLYADAGVNAYYFAMSIYGWIHWSDTKSGKGQIPITRLSPSERDLALFIFFVSFFVIRIALSFTPSDLPTWDAFTTSSAITAMWLMARKKIEHWIFWLICDLSSIPLYAYKGLYFTSIQFLLFTIIATLGLLSWQKKLRT